MIITLFTVAALYSCKHQQTPLTKEEVIAVINQFDKGWESKNMQAVDSALATGYTYFTQSGGIFSRDSVVVTAGQPYYSLEKMERSDLEITLYDNTAIVSTKWRGKGVYRGDAFDEEQRCSITIVKKDNQVKILSEHCTPIKTKRIFH